MNASPSDVQGATVAELTAERGAAFGAWLGQNATANADGHALREAAALAPLVQTNAGPGFEPASFAELVEFISELPF